MRKRREGERGRDSNVASAAGEGIILMQLLSGRERERERERVRD